jgi:hypothetical protein
MVTACISVLLAFSVNFLLCHPCRSSHKIPPFMRRYLESFQHSLFVHVFSKESELLVYDIPLFGVVEYSTIKFFLSSVVTLYGLVYSLIGANYGVQCSGLL